ncbi:MAG: CoA transferase, partial [Quisquiliibacterium sp.]
AARGAMVDTEHPRAGPVKLVGVPVKLSRTPGAIRSPSPMLGEHSAETLREVLGMGDAEIKRLMQAGVVHGAVQD